MRREWMTALNIRDPLNDLTIKHPTEHNRVSFLVLGDPGEGDASQYAVVPPLERIAPDTDFMVICSDVIYPAGGAGEYGEKFYRPYRNYKRPIYALPGNHDWYDNLSGFMHHFCGCDHPVARPTGRGWRGLLRRALWRRPPPLDDTKVSFAQREREERQNIGQPGPYFAIDAGPVLLVAIDTGIRGDIDYGQGEWLRAVSRSVDKPKILLTGKPIYVNGEHRPCDIEGGGTVDDIVVSPSNRYIAAIGGDIHNYQRYPITLNDGRVIQYAVSGGGGAFMHATHDIPNIDCCGLGVSESDFRCYPLRGDSLAILSKRYTKRLGWLFGKLDIPPDEASSLIAHRLGLSSTRSKIPYECISSEYKRRFEKIFDKRTRFHGLWHYNASQFFDWNDPPMFKNFLRIDANQQTITITCYAATGCREDELTPLIEDQLVANDTGTTWEWSDVHA